jgi:hypothetical protein
VRKPFAPFRKCFSVDKRIEICSILLQALYKLSILRPNGTNDIVTVIFIFIVVVVAVAIA